MVDGVVGQAMDFSAPCWVYKIVHVDLYWAADRLCSTGGSVNGCSVKIGDCHVTRTRVLTCMFVPPVISSGYGYWRLSANGYCHQATFSHDFVLFHTGLFFKCLSKLYGPGQL